MSTSVSPLQCLGILIHNTPCVAGARCLRGAVLQRKTLLQRGLPHQETLKTLLALTDRKWETGLELMSGGESSGPWHHDTDLGRQAGVLHICAEHRMHTRNTEDFSLFQERLFTLSSQTDTHQPSWDLIADYLSIARVWSSFRAGQGAALEGLEGRREWGRWCHYIFILNK